jgi:hypothetical protein
MVFGNLTIKTPFRSRQLSINTMMLHCVPNHNIKAVPKRTHEYCQKMIIKKNCFICLVFFVKMFHKLENLLKSNVLAFN